MQLTRFKPKQPHFPIWDACDALSHRPHLESNRKRFPNLPNGERSKGISKPKKCGAIDEDFQDSQMWILGERFPKAPNVDFGGTISKTPKWGRCGVSIPSLQTPNVYLSYPVTSILTDISPFPHLGKIFRGSPFSPFGNAFPHRPHMGKWGAATE